MNHTQNRVRTSLRWAFSAGLMLSLTPLVTVVQAQEIPGTQPPGSPLDLFVPAVPAVSSAPSAHTNTFRTPDGKTHLLPLRTVQAHSRPELAARNNERKQTSPLPAEQPSAEGDRGVRVGQPDRSPFGSKGETVAIAFRSGLYRPALGERLQPALMQVVAEKAQRASAGEADAGSVYGLILFNGSPEEETLASLKSLGVETLGYYPHCAQLAKIPISTIGQAASVPGVRWIGQPGFGQKIAPELRDQVLQGQKMARRGMAPTYDVFVALYGKDKSGSVRAKLQSLGAKISLYDEHIAVAAIYGADELLLNRLAGANETLYIEPILTNIPFDTQSMSAINADQMWGIQDPAPAATRVRVGEVDTGVYMYHNDFTNIFGGSYGYSLISGENWYDDLQGHGSHVAGTMMGEGRAQGRYRGVAEALTSHGTPTTDPDLVVAQVFPKAGSGSGAILLQGFSAMNGEYSGITKRQVFNYSGGTNNTNPATGQTNLNYQLTGTDTQSRKTDDLFANNVLPVIAAGNDGGPQLVASPGCAKGALTVGAIYDDGSSADVVTYYSSNGPTGDFRIKPDLVAPGDSIMSVKRGTYSSYFADQGTSMATPHVTGVAAGLIGFLNMPAWATKATLIANAIDLGQSSNLQGRGKVDAMMNHYAIDGNWHTFWWSNGSTGSVNYVDMTLPSAVSKLQVVMTYPDPAAAAGASKAIVNDVDLCVQSGALTTAWGGNWYSQSSYDTVESINLYNLAAGTYRIKVKSYAVSGSQAVALCYHYTYGSVSPNVTASISVPYAVRPNTTFYPVASAYSNSYVASSVVGRIGLGSGLTNNAFWQIRKNPSGSSEYLKFPDASISSGDSYSLYSMNMGDIAAFNTRQQEWELKAPSYEGTQAVNFSTQSKNGGSAAAYNAVIVDGTPPAWNAAGPVSYSWTGALHASVQISVQDVRAGLQVGTAYYRHSSDGGTTWSVWTNTSSTGSNGTTAFQTITAPDVPFGHNDPAKNKIQFYIVDMAGNSSYSPIYDISTPVLAYGYVPLEGCVNPAQPISLVFRPSDGSGNLAVSTTLDATGYYYVSGIPAGKTWTVWTKGDRWLANYGTLDTTDLFVAYAGTAALLAGDVNGNNVVDVDDLTDLLNVYNTTQGDGTYETKPTADLNCDTHVNVDDLTLLLTNYNTNGVP